MPSALTAVLVSSLAIWALAKWFPDPIVGASLPPLALAVGAAVAATGLAGADEALDRTAAIDWPTRRLVHVLIIAVVVVGMFAAIQLIAGQQLIPLATALRDGAGLTGLAALGVTVLGAPLAWLFPVVSTAAAMMAPPSVQVITWELQAPDTTAAAVTAIILAVGGTVLHALLGPRRTV
ncbi:MAG TPA: hypothetical protein VGM75_38580 [Pseudonocardiaceae bacterium]